MSTPSSASVDRRLSLTAEPSEKPVVLSPLSDNNCKSPGSLTTNPKNGSFSDPWRVSPRVGSSNTEASMNSPKNGSFSGSLLPMSKVKQDAEFAIQNKPTTEESMAVGCTQSPWSMMENMNFIDNICSAPAGITDKENQTIMHSLIEAPSQSSILDQSDEQEAGNEINDDAFLPAGVEDAAFVPRTKEADEDFLPPDDEDAFLPPMEAAIDKDFLPAMIGHLGSMDDEAFLPTQDDFLSCKDEEEAIPTPPKQKNTELKQDGPAQSEITAELRYELDTRGSKESEVFSLWSRSAEVAAEESNEREHISSEDGTAKDATSTILQDEGMKETRSTNSIHFDTAVAIHSDSEELDQLNKEVRDALKISLRRAEHENRSTIENLQSSLYEAEELNEKLKKDCASYHEESKSLKASLNRMEASMNRMGDEHAMMKCESEAIIQNLRASLDEYDRKLCRTEAEHATTVEQLSNRNTALQKENNEMRSLTSHQSEQIMKKDGTIDELTDRITKLEAETKEEKELSDIRESALQQENEKLNTTVEEYKNTINKKVEEIQEGCRIIEAAMKENEALTASNDKIWAESEKLKLYVAQQRDAINMKDQELQEAAGNLELALKEKEKSQQKVDMLHSEVEKLKLTNEHQQEGIRSKDKDLQIGTEKLDAALKENEELKSLIAALRLESKQLETSLHELQQKSNEKDNHLQQKTEDLNASLEEKGTLNSLIEALRLELQELKSSAEQMHERTAQKDEEIEQLHERTTQKDEEIEQKSTRLELSLKELADLKQMNEDLWKESHDFKSTIQELRRKIEGKDRVILDCKEKSKAVEQEQEKMIQNMDAASREAVHLSAITYDLKATLSTKEQELREKSKDLQAALTKKEEMNSSLHAQQVETKQIKTLLEEHQITLGLTKQKLNEMRMRLEAAASEQRQLNECNNYLKTERSHLKSTIEDQQAEISRNDHLLHEMKQEIVELTTSVKQANSLRVQNDEEKNTVIASLTEQVQSLKEECQSHKTNLLQYKLESLGSRRQLDTETQPPSAELTTTNSSKKDHCIEKKTALNSSKSKNNFTLVKASRSASFGVEVQADRRLLACSSSESTSSSELSQFGKPATPNVCLQGDDDADLNQIETVLDIFDLSVRSSASSSSNDSSSTDITDYIDGQGAVPMTKKLKSLSKNLTSILGETKRECPQASSKTLEDKVGIFKIAYRKFELERERIQKEAHEDKERAIGELKAQFEEEKRALEEENRNLLAIQGREMRTTSSVKSVSGKLEARTEDTKTEKKHDSSSTQNVLTVMTSAQPSKLEQIDPVGDENRKTEVHFVKSSAQIASASSKSAPPNKLANIKPKIDTGLRKTAQQKNRTQKPTLVSEGPGNDGNTGSNDSKTISSLQRAVGAASRTSGQETKYAKVPSGTEVSRKPASRLKTPSSSPRKKSSIPPPSLVGLHKKKNPVGGRQGNSKIPVPKSANQKNTPRLQVSSKTTKMATRKTKLAQPKTNIPKSGVSNVGRSKLPTPSMNYGTEVKSSVVACQWEEPVLMETNEEQKKEDKTLENSNRQRSAKLSSGEMQLSKKVHAPAENKAHVAENVELQNDVTFSTLEETFSSLLRAQESLTPRGSTLKGSNKAFSSTVATEEAVEVKNANSTSRECPNQGSKELEQKKNSKPIPLSKSQLMKEDDKNHELLNLDYLATVTEEGTLVSEASVDCEGRYEPNGYVQMRGMAAIFTEESLPQPNQCTEITSMINETQCTDAVTTEEHSEDAMSEGNGNEAMSESIPVEITEDQDGSAASLCRVREDSSSSLPARHDENKEVPEGEKDSDPVVETAIGDDTHTAREEVRTAHPFIVEDENKHIENCVQVCTATVVRPTEAFARSQDDRYDTVEVSDGTNEVEVQLESEDPSLTEAVESLSFEENKTNSAIGTCSEGQGEDNNTNKNNPVPDIVKKENKCAIDHCENSLAHQDRNNDLSIPPPIEQDNDEDRVSSGYELERDDTAIKDPACGPQEMSWTAKNQASGDSKSPDLCASVQNLPEIMESKAQLDDRSTLHSDSNNDRDPKLGDNNELEGSCVSPVNLRHTSNIIEVEVHPEGEGSYETSHEDSRSVSFQQGRRTEAEITEEFQVLHLLEKESVAIADKIESQVDSNVSLNEEGGNDVALLSAEDDYGSEPEIMEELASADNMGTQEDSVILLHEGIVIEDATNCQKETSLSSPCGDGGGTSASSDMEEVWVDIRDLKGHAAKPLIRAELEARGAANVDEKWGIKKLKEELENVLNDGDPQKFKPFSQDLADFVHRRH